MKYIYSILIILLLTLFNQVYSQCNITNLTTTLSECTDDNTFDVSFNFEFEEVSDSFEIKGNGVEYGLFAYSDIPVTISGLTGDCETSYEFVINDRDSVDCNIDEALGVICCEQICDIEIIDFEANRCDDGLLNISFDLETRFTSPLEFDVYSGDEFVGAYSYDDLPISINDFPSGGSSSETLIVCDNDSSTCCDTLTFETICGCSITDIRTTIIDCSETQDSFNIFLDFNHNMTSDSFRVGGNNTNYGMFAYNDLPVQFGPLPFSENIEYEVIVLDKESSFCFNFSDIGIVNGCPEGVIYNVQAIQSACQPDGNFLVDLSFETQGNLSDSFIVKGNGSNYGTFSYEENTIQIGPLEGDCTTIYEFEVIDNGSDSIRNYTELDDVVCCEPMCIIDNVELVQGECNEDGNFFVDISFTTEGIISDSFIIRGNGIVYDTLPYGETSYSVGPLSGDCLTLYEFIIIDLEDIECSSFGVLDEFVCCVEPCKLSVMEAELVCPGDGTFVVEIDESELTSEDTLMLVLNDIALTVTKDDFPYRGMEADFSYPLNITLTQNSNEECSLSVQIEEGCEDACDIRDITSEFIGCNDDDEIFLTIDAITEMTVSDSFNVFFDDSFIISLPYDSLPLTLGPVMNPDGDFILSLEDAANELCRSELTVENIICESSVESMQNIGIDVQVYSNAISIFNRNHELSNLYLYSIDGKLQTAIEFYDQAEINTSFVPTGVYLLAIKTSLGHSTQKIFIR